MDWNNNNNPASVAPSTAFTYTYPGSPTRYSITIDEGFLANYLTIPTAASVVTGWVAMPFYIDGSYAGNTNLLTIEGGAGGRQVRIYMDNGGAESFDFYLDNVFKEAFVMSANNWHYLAVKYDMSGTTWSGQVYLNGAPLTAAYTDGGATAETSSQTTLGGIAGGTRNTYIGQIVIYDSLLDAGEVPLYVTRIAPNADTAEIPPGGWSPSVGLTDFGVTNNDPFDSSTYTEQAAPNSGDNMVTEVNNLAVQLGVVAGSVIGVTNHTYSSGTALQAFASVRDSGGVYADGATITPDPSPDTTYAFATGTVGFTGASVVECKYEIV
jgi:hypothetical protein